MPSEAVAMELCDHQSLYQNVETSIFDDAGSTSSLVYMRKLLYIVHIWVCDKEMHSLI